MGSASRLRSSNRQFTLLLFALALLPRVYVALAWAREPVWDGHYYDIGARSIAAGLGYAGESGGPWCHYPVGYSALLAAAYAVFGPGQHVGPLLNALTGALLAVAVYRLARHATSEMRARVAGGVVAAYPGLVAYSAVLMTELAAALAVVAAALAAARWRDSRRGVIVGGLLLGLGALVRPQSLLCAPALGLFALESQAPGAIGRAVRGAVLATALCLATVAPWTVRNCLVMDGCALVSTNGGWNLAIGSFPRATGRFATLRGSDGCRIVTGQVQQDRCWLHMGLGWIRADPSRWLALVPKKLAHTFDHESFAIGYLGEADPTTWSEARKHLGRGVLSNTHRLVLVLAGLGLVARTRRQRWPRLAAVGAVAALALHAATDDYHPFWPLALVIPLLALARLGARRGRAVLDYCAFAVASVCLTHAVFFGEDRYHLVVTPLLCLLAACALAPASQRPAADPSA
jgi:hypothetical protein